MLMACPRSLRQRRASGGQSHGFTLVEMMVAIAIIAVLLALAAPSMREMIEMRRLRAINAQLVTDLQYVRSEAIARRAYGRIEFNVDPTLPLTCYTIYTAIDSLKGCDCNLGAGKACKDNPGAVEIRTVQVPKSTATVIGIPGVRGVRESLMWTVGFEAAMGSLVGLLVDTNPQPLAGYAIDTRIDAARSMRIMLSQSGRPTVCAPAGSRVELPPCP